MSYKAFLHFTVFTAIPNVRVAVAYLSWLCYIWDILNVILNRSCTCMARVAEYCLMTKALNTESR